MVDHACNLRCGYCYTGEKFRRPMTLATAKAAIELALSRQPFSLELSFFGGEPLLHPELLEAIVKYAQERLGAHAPRCPLSIGLNTNATLIDDRILTWLAELPRKTVFLSLDGPASVHDRFRRSAAGQGSHSLVLSGLQQLMAASVAVEVVAVSNPETAEHLGEVAEYLLSLRCARVTVVPNLRANWNETSLEVARQGMLQAAEAWMAHLRAGGVTRLEPLSSKILTHLRGTGTCPSRCELTSRELAVAASGNLYPCAQLVGEDADSRYVIGHVSRGIDTAAVAALQQAKQRVRTLCEGCSLQPRCTSDCGCRQVALTGELGAISEVLCEWETLAVEAADRAGNTLHAEGNPSFAALFYGALRGQPRALAPLTVRGRPRD